MAKLINNRKMFLNKNKRMIKTDQKRLWLNYPTGEMEANTHIYTHTYIYYFGINRTDD